MRGRGHMLGMRGRSDTSGGGVPSGIALTAVTSSKVFQRDIASTSGPVALAGTYTGGAPTGVQARIKLTADNSVVQDWTTLSGATIGSGAWSGSVTVPQGGAYYTEVRALNATAVTASGATNWFVGIVCAWYGQSNSLGHFTRNDSAPAANAQTAYYDPTTGWGTMALANGCREFANRLNTLTGVPVGLVNGGASGVNVAALVPGQATYTEFTDRITASGGKCEFLMVHQGEGDGNTAAPSLATFLAAWDTIHDGIATLVGRTRAQCPLVASGLATVTDVSFTFPDSSWWTIQQAWRTCNTLYPNMHYAANNYSAVLRVDGVHWDGASYGRSGTWYAQKNAALLGIGGVSAPNWSIASIAAVDATTTDVTLTHSMGTDFTPTSGITGFTLSNDNFGSSNVTPSAAVRQSATVIRLTTTDLGVLPSRQLRYQYGKVPVVSAPVLDNGALAAPLCHTAGQSLATAGIPSPTFVAAYSPTRVGGPPCTNTQTGVDFGDGSVERVGVLGGVLADTNNQSISSVIVTPSGGSPITFDIAPQGGVTTATAPCTWIASKTLPAGAQSYTNCTVVITYAANTFANTRMSAWTFPTAGLVSATPTGTESVRAAAATSVSSTGAATSANGFVIAVGASIATGTANSFSAGATSRSEGAFSGVRAIFGDASLVAAGFATVTVANPTANNMRVAVAAWR